MQGLPPHSLFATIAALSFVASLPASAVLTDVNSINGSCATASVALTRTKAIEADGGRMSLTGCTSNYVPGSGCSVASGDIDCFLIDNVRKGDIITAVTTPMRDEFRDYPDTMIAIFDASDPLAPRPAALVEDTCGDFNITFACDARSDDSENNDSDAAGNGSLVRFRVPDTFPGANTFCVCVTGYKDDNWVGNHPEQLQEDTEGPFIFGCLGPDGIPDTGDEPLGSCTTTGNYQLMLIVTPPRPGVGCGLGFELALLVPALLGRRLRRRGVL